MLIAMTRTTERLKSFSQNVNKKLILLVVSVILLVVIVYNIPTELSITEKITYAEKPNEEIQHATVDDIREAYDPIVHRQKILQRLRSPCKVALPTREQALANRYSWSVSRYVSYHNIVDFLRGYLNDTTREYVVQEFGVSGFLHPFRNRLSVKRSAYPDVDIHKTPYESNSIDIVAADQVIEHIHFPHAAVLELKRILKPGGIMILTTCAYNPVHATITYPDFWRFMQDGLKLLSVPLDGGIRLCGGWGTKEVISMRVKLGILTPAERDAFSKVLPDAVTRNDLGDPFTTWIIMQK